MQLLRGLLCGRSMEIRFRRVLQTGFALFLFLLSSPVFAQNAIAPDLPPDPVILIPGLIASYNKKVILKDKTGGNWNFVPFGNIYI